MFEPRPTPTMLPPSWPKTAPALRQAALAASVGCIEVAL